jgi:hypothetical protein
MSAVPSRRLAVAKAVLWAFGGLLLGAIGVLALDPRDRSEQDGWWSLEVPALSPTSEPLLPTVQNGLPSPPDDPRRFVTASEATLGQPMRFTLETGGVLAAKGSIDPGAAERLASELKARGKQVRVVSLNSPGGTLDGAMAIAKLVRGKGLATEVADGALCASSCPLLLAGGLTRTVGAEAAVGVHQFYEAMKTTTAPDQAMADAQITIARISRHLIDMGVDPVLWLHALDTPPQTLYYFSSGEMAKYRLATAPVSTAGHLEPVN